MGWRFCPRSMPSSAVNPGLPTAIEILRQVWIQNFTGMETNWLIGE